MHISSSRRIFISTRILFFIVRGIFQMFKSGIVGDRRVTVTLGPEPAVSIYIPKLLPSETVDQIVYNIIYVL